MTWRIPLLMAVLATAPACADDASPPRRLDPATPGSARNTTDFPLQLWMKATVQPAIASGDLGSLVSGFDRIAVFTPDDYEGWATVAARGARAARAGDLEACRAACKQCHDQFRERYRAQHRGRPLKAKER